MICKWCEREIKGWYLTYKGMCFCERNNESCIKNYLREEYDAYIKSDYTDGEVIYDMSELE